MLYKIFGDVFDQNAYVIVEARLLGGEILLEVGADSDLGDSLLLFCRVVVVFLALLDAVVVAADIRRLFVLLLFGGGGYSCNFNSVRSKKLNIELPTTEYAIKISTIAQKAI